MPPPTISTALLVPQDRVARLPISAWSARLRTRLHDARSTERRCLDHAEALAGVGNNAALVATYQGSFGLAAALCEAQIRSQDRMSRRARDPRVGLLGIQPWVNLGRLEALRGDWEAALQRFSRLVHPGGDGRLCLGTLRVAADEDAANGLHRGFLLTVYIVDSLKALLMSRRFEEVLRFAERMPTDDPRMIRRADEARVVAHCRLGDAERALTVAEAASSASAGWNRAVFRLRRVETLLCMGQEEKAVDALNGLSNVLLGAAPAARGRLENMYIVNRTAHLCAEADLGDAAAALARATREAAEAAEDEVARIEALRLLCTVAPEEREGEPGSVLRDLERSTGYARYRSDGATELRDPEADLLYTELRATFSG